MSKSLKRVRSMWTSAATMPIWRIRIATIVCLLSVCGLAPVLAQESAYPRKPITLLIPFAAGGGTDTVARMIGQKLHNMLAQPVVVENRPGANGLLASRALLQQPADGYTLLFASNSTHVIAPLASKQSPDAMKSMQSDFAIICVVANAPLVLAVKASSPDHELQGFLKRASTSKLSYGSFGAGSSAHVMGEVLAEASGTDLLHVPYKGSAPALNDLLGGQVDSVFLTVAAIESMVLAAKVRPLAVTGRTRVASLPQVPTFLELGYRDMANAGWFAIFAKSNSPTVVTTTLSSSLRKILAEKETRTKLLELGLEPVGNTVQEAQETWTRSINLARPVVMRANIEF